MNSIILEKGFVSTSLRSDSQALLLVKSLSVEETFTTYTAKHYSISIVWQESIKSKKIECQAYYYSAEGLRKPVALETDSKTPGYKLVWPAHFPEILKENFILHTDCHSFAESANWNKFKGLNKTLISIPAFGKIANEWKDGWMAHFSTKGQVLSLVPPGSISRLRVPVENDLTYQGLSWDEAMLSLPNALQRQHHCIVSMLRASCFEEDLNKMMINAFDLETAIRLLLMRQAFPTCQFKIYHPSPKKIWPARFKNFLNCLDADSAQSLVGANGIRLDGFFASLGAYDLAALAPLLNAKTRILAGLN